MKANIQRSRESEGAVIGAAIGAGAAIQPVYLDMPLLGKNCVNSYFVITLSSLFFLFYNCNGMIIISSFKFKSRN